MWQIWFPDKNVSVKKVVLIVEITYFRFDFYVNVAKSQTSVGMVRFFEIVPVLIGFVQSVERHFEQLVSAADFDMRETESQSGRNERRAVNLIVPSS